MAYFAEVNEKLIVLRVLAVDYSQEHRGQDFLSIDLGLGGLWIQTSYNTRGGIHMLGGKPFRKNFAGIGFKYDPDRDAFIPPMPEGNYVLNEITCLWDAITP